MAVLESLILKANSEYSAEYKIGDVGGISNHLPMCLFALQKLGADDDRLKSFYSAYVGKLLPRQDTPNFRPEKWQSFLGQNRFNKEFSNYFFAKIDAIGVERCSAEYLPYLLPGIGGAAFHPVIRLAYAIQLGVKNEIAESFASWCMGYVNFEKPGIDKSVSTASPSNILKQFCYDDSFKMEKYEGPSVVERMKAVAKDDAFWRIFKTPKDLQLSDLADCAIKIFLSKPNFTALHLVTACYAVRVITDKLGRIEGLLEKLWIPFCIAYVSLGAPDFSRNIKYECFNWDTLFKKAIDSNDDHWCKFVYTCSEEYKAYGASFYQMAATKYLAS